MNTLLRTILFPGLVFLAGYIQGQEINNLRPLDNNHALATESSGWKLHRVIKEIPLYKANHSVLLSLGGEIREQVRFYSHTDFGHINPDTADNDLYLHQRFMMHADLQVNKFLRFFIQFNSCHVSGKNSISPEVDRDDLGIMQGFADLRIKTPVALQLRIGRQEISYGPERINSCP